MIKRKCIKCGEEKTLDNFLRNKVKSHLRAKTCKICLHEMRLSQERIRKVKMKLKNENKTDYSKLKITDLELALGHLKLKGCEEVDIYFEPDFVILVSSMDKVEIKIKLSLDMSTSSEITTTDFVSFNKFRNVA